MLLAPANVAIDWWNNMIPLCAANLYAVNCPLVQTCTVLWCSTRSGTRGGRTRRWVLFVL